MEAQHGEISLETYKESLFKLKEFKMFAAAEGLRDIGDVTEDVLENYRLAQLELTDSKVAGEDLVSKVTARKRLARLRQFLQHAWGKGGFLRAA